MNAEQMARRAALRSVMRPWRYLGLLLVLVGAGLLVFARSAPGLSHADWALPAAYALLVLGWIVLILVVVVRTRQNARLERADAQHNR